MISMWGGPVAGPWACAGLSALPVPWLRLGYVLLGYEPLPSFIKSSSAHGGTVNPLVRPLETVPLSAN